MAKKVLKFGGTSVGSIQRIQHAAKIIKKEHDNGNKLIVVVSAMAGTNRAVGDGVNIVKKHQKPNPNKNEPGGITSKTMPIHILSLIHI